MVFCDYLYHYYNHEQELYEIEQAKKLKLIEEENLEAEQLKKLAEERAFRRYSTSTDNYEQNLLHGKEDSQSQLIGSNLLDNSDSELSNADTYLVDAYTPLVNSDTHNVVKDRQFNDGNNHQEDSSMVQARQFADTLDQIFEERKASRNLSRPIIWNDASPIFVDTSSNEEWFDIDLNDEDTNQQNKEPSQQNTDDCSLKCRFMKAVADVKQNVSEVLKVTANTQIKGQASQDTGRTNERSDDLSSSVANIRTRFLYSVRDMSFNISETSKQSASSTLFSRMRKSGDHLMKRFNREDTSSDDNYDLVMDELLVKPEQMKICSW